MKPYPEFMFPCLSKDGFPGNIHTVHGKGELQLGGDLTDTCNITQNSIT